MTQKGLPVRQAGLSPILIVVILAVLVGGYLIYKLPRTVVTPQTPQATPIPTSSAANPAPSGAGETANWKTYTNIKSGFSLSYPANAVDENREADPFPVARQFSVNNSKDPLRYFDGWLIIISETQPNPDKLSLRDWAKSLKNARLLFTNQEVQNGIGTNPENISIGGKTAIVWRGHIEGTFIYYLVQRDNGITYITVNIGGNENKYKPEIDRVLSTFKFTN